jgi:Response regulator consisting of a CheY-like receiver domain and a Fis-type HTH domain
MNNIENTKNISNFEDKSLLIVDDDNPFRERLARAMEKKGFKVSQAKGVKKGIDIVNQINRSICCN